MSTFFITVKLKCNDQTTEEIKETLDFYLPDSADYEYEIVEVQKVEKHTNKQISGPRCKQCGAFTTYARVKSHGLCMKCEIEKRGGNNANSAIQHS